MSSEYKDDVVKHAGKCDDKVLTGIVKHCGIALQNKDSSLVSCSQKHEMERVRENFLKKKLGLTRSDDDLDKAIEEICDRMGRSDPNKSRVTFYYLLAEKFGKADLFT